MSNKESKIEIGIVTVEYNVDGTFKSSTFVPTLESVITDNAFREINFKGKSISDEESIKEIADTSLAGFYTDMETIELADRESFEIVSEIQKQLCEKYDNGTVKSCTLKYYFKSR